MLRGSGELQLEQISLFCSYVTTGLQEKEFRGGLEERLDSGRVFLSFMEI